MQPVCEPSNTKDLVVQVMKQARLVGSSVWAVATTDRRPRCSRVVQRGNHIYLSALREGEPPLYSHTLPVSLMLGGM